MYSTKNDLPENSRVQVIELCNTRLADAIDLMLQAKQAHWNVKGAMFIALHELYDDVSEAIEEYVDLLAERAVQLGGRAEGTLAVAVTRTALAEYPLNITDGTAHNAALSSNLAAFGKSARQGIDLATEYGDADTADLFTEVSRGIDKLLWMVEAHLN